MVAVVRADLDRCHLSEECRVVLGDHRHHREVVVNYRQVVDLGLDYRDQDSAQAVVQ